MTRFFKDECIKVQSHNTLREKLEKALDSTTSVCVASTSALVINPLTEKILKNRREQYYENSYSALIAVARIRSFLLKISKFMEENKMTFLDAKASIKYTMSEWRAGNCEHQSFYLAALLKQQNIPALIYDIEDIQHTVVITNDYLLDPWIGTIFPLTENLGEFYNSSLNMNASWLNRLLCNKEYTYPEKLNKQTLNIYFVQVLADKKEKVNCCNLI